jgi:hypothetical protein
MTRRRLRLAVGMVAIAVFALAATSFAVAGGGKGRNGKGNGNGSVSARMNGYQEVPSLNSPGTGRFRATIERDKITFRLEYSNLTGDAMVAHVHVGQPGVNGGVSFFLCGGGGKAACPTGTSGSVTGTVVAGDVVGPTAQGFAEDDLTSVIAAIRAGVTYANIHTMKYPGGEIRGQLNGHGRFGGWNGGDEDNDSDD